MLKKSQKKTHAFLKKGIAQHSFTCYNEKNSHKKELSSKKDGKKEAIFDTEESMKNGPYESEGARRHFAYSKVDVMKLDTKCLFAGKLERIRDWEEKPHSHAFCEIMFVEAGAGEVVVDGVRYPIKKGDIVIYNSDAVQDRKSVV